MDWLLSPLTWFVVAAALISLAWLPRRRPWLAVAGGLIALAMLAAMTPFGANLLLVPLERPRPVPASCEASPPVVAIVPGGGVEGWPRSALDYSALNLASRRRVERAVDWYRAGAGRSLVLQGGSSWSRGVPVAALMATYAQALGVPASALRVETGSGDTRGNARHATEISPALPRRIVLVTSWVHLPRAVRAYEQAGFDICPLGTDSRRLPSRLPWALTPRTRALANAEIALHEWIGLAWYRLGSRQLPADTE